MTFIWFIILIVAVYGLTEYVINWLVRLLWAAARLVRLFTVIMIVVFFIGVYLDPVFMAKFFRWLGVLAEYLIRAIKFVLEKIHELLA